MRQIFFTTTTTSEQTIAAKDDEGDLVVCAKTYDEESVSIYIDKTDAIALAEAILKEFAQTKPNQTKPNQTKPNQTKPNQTKPNQTKPNENLQISRF